MTLKIQMDKELDIMILFSCQEYKPGNPGGAWSQVKIHCIDELSLSIDAILSIKMHHLHF